MEDDKSYNWSKIAVVLAIVTFMLASTAVLIKYVRTGEFDITTLLAGIVIPGVIYVLAKSKG